MRRHPWPDVVDRCGACAAVQFLSSAHSCVHNTRVGVSTALMHNQHHFVSEWCIPASE